MGSMDRFPALPLLSSNRNSLPLNDACAKHSGGSRTLTLALMPLLSPMAWDNVHSSKHSGVAVFSNSSDITTQFPVLIPNFRLTPGGDVWMSVTGALRRRRMPNFGLLQTSGTDKKRMLLSKSANLRTMLLFWQFPPTGLHVECFSTNSLCGIFVFEQKLKKGIVWGQ